jgi:hypothetical protein
MSGAVCEHSRNPTFPARRQFPYREHSMMQVPLPTPTSGSESIWIRILEWALSVGGGVLAALVAFRLRLGNMDNKLTEHEKEIARVKEGYTTAITEHKNDVSVEAMRAERAFRDSLEAMRKETDTRHEDNRRELRLLRKQSFLTLKMIADIARHTGADKRFDDAIWSALAADRDDDS